MANGTDWRPHSTTNVSNLNSRILGESGLLRLMQRGFDACGRGASNCSISFNTKLKIEKSRQTPIDIRYCTSFRMSKQNVSFDEEENDDDILDCGTAVNFTFYDDLIGIAQRYNHPNVPEPEVSEHFDTKASLNEWKL